MAENGKRGSRSRLRRNVFRMQHPTCADCRREGEAATSLLLRFLDGLDSAVFMPDILASIRQEERHKVSFLAGCFGWIWASRISSIAVSLSEPVRRHV